MRPAWIILLALACAVILAPACSRNPSSGIRLYVSNETAGEVVVVDPDRGTVLRRIAVGKRPRGVRLSPDGAHLFVALSGSPIAGPGVDESALPPADRRADGIGIIDIDTGKVLRRLPSGQDPEAFDVSADGTTLYVSNEETSQMTVIDLKAGVVTGHVRIGEEPEGVALRPDGRVVYVTCEADNTVVAIDTTTLQVIARIEVPPRPRAIVFTRDGATGFVTSENGAAVSAFATSSHTPLTVIEIPRSATAPTAARPMGAVVTPDGRLLLVSNGRAQSIAVLDVATRRLLKVIENVGARPWGIATSPDGRRAYTANGPSEDVSVIDLEAAVVERRIKVGGSPWGLAVAPR